MKKDFIKLNQKKELPLEYQTERKSPLFWIILSVVGTITATIIFFIVNSDPSDENNKKIEEFSIPEEKKKAPEDMPKKIEPPLKAPEKAPVKKDETPIQISGDIGEKIKTVENMMASGNFLEARKLLYELHGKMAGQNSALDRVEELIGKVNIEIFKSDIPAPEKKLYTIEKGDALVKIADKFNTTVEAIQKANRMEPGTHSIFPGKTLCIYEGKWSINVSKSKMTLRLMDGDKLFKVYKVGIGRQGRTPSGKFEVSTKQKEPVWYTEGKAIPFGDPQNILGTRWIALTPSGSTDKNLKGYGIHGTWEEDSVGQATSNGCVRMKNEDVEELFSIIPTKITVIIED